METVKVECHIPERKADITMKQWLEWENITEANKDDLESQFVYQKMIEIFCKVPFDYVSLLKQTEIEEMLTYIDVVFKQKSEFVKTFVFEGVEYGFIPNFKKDITQGEQFDLETYHQSKDWVRILSILYRPITKNINGLYQIEPYDGTHTKFENLGYNVFDGCIGFFLHTLETLSKHFLLFTQKELKKLNKMNTQKHLQDSIEILNSLTNMEFNQNWFS